MGYLDIARSFTDYPESHESGPGEESVRTCEISELSVKNPPVGGPLNRDGNLQPNLQPATESQK